MGVSLNEARPQALRATTAQHESAAIVHTLVTLGKLLGIETLAEGIEETEQLSVLEREHCDRGQGFLLARPVEVEEIERLLGAGREARRATAAA
jgi:EAL domain-containing protein (putative c-di-GMP-specific phosphodiesterase class I)